MKPSEVIDIMLTEIIPDESRWQKHSLYTPGSGLLGRDPKYCMLGALNMAVTRQPGPPMACWCWPVWDQTYEVINDQIAQLNGGMISIYNDAEGRTYDEVRAVLEKARAAAQEMGQ